MKRDVLLPPIAAASGDPGGARGVVACAAAITVGLLWMIGWYWGTATDIARIWWRSETFAHGLLVLPIFAWLVWRKRDALAPLAPQPVPLLALPLALAGLAWLVGELVSVAALSHAAFGAMVLLGAVALLGWRIARVLAFALAFLLFGIPVGEFLLPVLMTYTAEFTVGALRLSGVPVYQEGLHFVVPNGRWSVVEACSGIRYLIASLMVGTLYAYLHYRSLTRRLVFVGVAIVVPIVANWVRAYLIVMLGYLSDNRIAAGVDHLIYGWVFFGIVMLAMFWIGARWREDHVPAPAAPPPAPAQRRRGWLAVLPPAIVVALFPPLLAHLHEPVAPFQVPLAAPAAAPGWIAVDDDLAGFRPYYRGHRGELYQAYRRADGETVALYVAYYAHQGPGAELVMWGNALVPSEDLRWAQVGSGRDELAIGSVRRAVVSDQLQRLAVWHWYWANGRVLTSDYAAKGVLALDRLTGLPDGSAFVALIAPIDERPDDARTLVAEFVGAHAAGIAALLADAEAGR